MNGRLGKSQLKITLELAEGELEIYQPAGQNCYICRTSSTKATSSTNVPKKLSLSYKPSALVLQERGINPDNL
jgi:hypothetical protein